MFNSYINDSDLTKEVRDKDMHPINATLSSSGCEYNGIDLKSLRVKCAMKDIRMEKYNQL